MDDPLAEEPLTEDPLPEDPLPEDPEDDGSAEPGDGSPGDGTVEPAPDTGDADHVRAVERGREAEAAGADTSESAPVPRETPAE